jgi:WD40 repeat protein
VYLWSEASGVEYPRVEEDLPGVYITSLAFSSTQGGHSILATGRSNGRVSLWSLHDAEDRFQCQQPHAVASLAFKPITTKRTSDRIGLSVQMEEILVGDELGHVYYYSVEWNDDEDSTSYAGSMNLMAKIEVHTQQICGIAWSHDGEYFATGGNDNICCLFEVRDVMNPQPPTLPDMPPAPLNRVASELRLNSSSSQQTYPSLLRTARSDSLYNPNGYIRVLRSNFLPGRAMLRIVDGRQKHKWVHCAAVKAIAFCPWQRGLLATGGGSNDRAIHFYHTWSGACLATISLQAQVTSLIWSTTRREIAATFGYAQPEHPYRIAVFSWPDCRQIVAIPWATETRALYAIPYPGGPHEVTGERDEGGRRWNRTVEEGCLVVASSDESVKFHEVWCEARRSAGGSTGLLGGSDILESLEGADKEGREIIR